MRIIKDPREMASWSAQTRRQGGRIGFVPTMGYLHTGHTTLMDRTRDHCDAMVVSIYVNPLQFGPGEDLERYPRDFAGDVRKCENHGAEVVFAPKNLYPPDFRTHVRVEHLTRHLCGASRPGHFDGVTTVVARLFGLVKPDVATFGEKDWQQLTIVRRMAEDLAMGIEILACPTVREPDGLALSSRNKYLSTDDRNRALTLSRALQAMQDERFPATYALKAAALPILDVDVLYYLEVVGEDDLEPLDWVDRPARALIAAQVGGTRLIDNMAILPG